MKTQIPTRGRGFTLLETVIAIGVLAVLLTGFMIVFAPAAAGIKKSISVQVADRLATTLEQELGTLRDGQQTASIKTGFDKAFTWLKENNSANSALLVYQYRGSLTSLRTDGTPEPVVSITSKIPGKDYAVVPMMRRRSDGRFLEDIAAVEGGIYLVKCTQLVFGTNGLTTGTAGQIRNPKQGGTPAGPFNAPDDYPEAVIAYSADFYPLPANSSAYFTSRFPTTFTNSKVPVFSRNLAVRR